ncbi:MAG TPA: GIY-YIG nuclease family protein [candidate division Zixibacteria bacterium]|nr:GIY-YIG nuclease family protein [candidate division Zixibacteria bacterium]
MKEVIKDIPGNPGVYFFFDSDEKLLYIGKAINLKKRITDHYRKGHDHIFTRIRSEKKPSRKRNISVQDLINKQKEDVDRIIYNKERKKKERIINEATKIRYIITENEDEALTLEGCLISALRPELNRQIWKYPFIEITLGEEIPRILTCYQTLLPDSYIFGPFNIASDIDLAIDGFLRVIPICNSMMSIIPRGRYPLACIREQVNRCLAPCKNNSFDSEQYTHFIRYFMLELENNGKHIIQKLERLMEKEIEEENFEGATIYRDRLLAIQKLFAARTMPTVLKKYYQKIREILGKKYNYQTIIDNILENNGKS